MKLRKCFITFVVCASLVVPGIFTSCKHPASPKNDNTKVENPDEENKDSQKTETETEKEITPEEIDPSSEKNPDEENKDSQKTEAEPEKEITPETDKKEEETSEAGISLLQEDSKEITKSEDGYTFTAPAGYAKYEWILRGQELGEVECTPSTTAKNVCSPITNTVKAKLVEGRKYRIEVKIYDSANKLQDILSYDFDYEEIE